MSSEVSACKAVVLDLVLLKGVAVRDDCSGVSVFLCKGGLGGEHPDLAGSLSPGTVYPIKLQEATVIVMSNDRCKDYWDDINFDIMLCAGRGGVSLGLVCMDLDQPLETVPQAAD